MKTYKYRSPYRPIPLEYMPKDIEFVYDDSDIGLWSPKSIYAFNKPLPESLIKQWDLKCINTVKLNTGEEYPI